MAVILEGVQMSIDVHNHVGQTLESKFLSPAEVLFRVGTDGSCHEFMLKA